MKAITAIFVLGFSTAHGDIIADAPGPLIDWGQPVVFSQALIGVPQNVLDVEAEKWGELGYHPVRIHCYLAPVDQIVGPDVIRPHFSAVWHKDANIITSAGEVDLTEKELIESHFDKYEAYQLVSLCATQELAGDAIPTRIRFCDFSNLCFLCSLCGESPPAVLLCHSARSVVHPRSP